MIPRAGETGLPSPPSEIPKEGAREARIASALTPLNSEFENLLCTALSRLRDAYPQDTLTPGLLLSRLHNGMFYVAVHRFPNKGARQVLMNGRGKTLTRAIENVGEPGTKARKVRAIR